VSLQMIVVLVLVGASALYFGRGFIKGLFGGCDEGGCAKCGSGGCAVQKLDTLRKEMEARRKA
jgi:hypothetical protein